MLERQYSSSEEEFMWKRVQLVLVRIFFFVIFFVYGCIWTLDGICKKVQDFLLL